MTRDGNFFRPAVDPTCTDPNGVGITLPVKEARQVQILVAPLRTRSCALYYCIFKDLVLNFFRPAKDPTFSDPNGVGITLPRQGWYGFW